MGEKSRRKRDQVRFGCYLCGQPFTPACPPTKDHVVPKCWFPLPLPPDVPTRKACSACNAALSPREERVRNLLARMHAQEPDQLQDVFQRSLRSGRQPRIVGETLWKIDSGLFVKADLAAFDAEDITAVFNKITRGLFFINYDRPLPVEHPVKAVPLTTGSGASFTKVVIGEWSRRVHWIGEALAWVNAVDDDHPEDGFWLYLPLHTAVTAVFTGRATSIPLPTPASTAALKR